MSNIAIENDPVEIVDFPIEHGDFLYSYVSLPEGNFIILAWFSGSLPMMG